MQTVSSGNVSITGGFWKNFQELNRTVTLNAVYDRFDETGRIRALSCDWVEGMDRKPHKFWDSDVFKWMEGASYVLAHEDDPILAQRLFNLIDEIEKHQWPDGYVQSYFTVCRPTERFTNRDDHELYCMGHLMEAAVAHFEATGSRRFLDIACRAADCIYKVFLEEQTAPYATSGHEEIELALMRLWRCTGNEKYRELCGDFLSSRGANTLDAPVCPQFNERYQQDHAPVRQQKTAEGHAVRACYLYTAMADYANAVGDVELLNACKALWEDITRNKMYLTGGIGSTYLGEAFASAGYLPDDTAYAETCAAISLAMFSQKMWEATGEAKYAATVERTLYNGVLSGLGLDGKSFFYRNPLRIDLRNTDFNRSTTEPSRQFPRDLQRPAIFRTSCCPPNLVRHLAGLGRYLYGRCGNEVYVNQYATSRWQENGTSIVQETNYPADGKISLAVKGVSALRLRVPEWCRSFTVSEDYALESGYIVIQAPPEKVTVEFAMEPALYRADPRFFHYTGKAAVQLGPIVYCAEGVDNPELHSLLLDKHTVFWKEYSEEYGCWVLTADGLRPAAADAPYLPLTTEGTPVKIRLIPYFAFANRGKTDMAVWLPTM